MSSDIASQFQTSPGVQHDDAWFRAVFEGAAIGIALVDMTGRPVQCNQALERILGYSEAELTCMKFPDFTHPDDVETALDLYQELIAGKRTQYQIEKRYKRKDGETVWARLTISLAPPRGESPQLVIGMVEDITARKAAEEALRESEEKFSKAFHGNPNPILITRRSDGRIVDVNEAFCQWFGLTPTDARNLTTFDFKFWDSDKEREELLQTLQRQGLVRNYQKTVVLPSGKQRTTRLSIHLITLRGEECLLTISDDVTQEIEAGEALKRSEERLRRGLESARMGIWEWNIEKNEVAWTEEVYSLFGLAPGQFGGKVESFLELINEEDRRRVHDEIQQTLNGTTRKYYSEMPIRRADGSMRWLESRGELKRDETGKASMMVGTVADVTDRKRAERALRSSEESLRATIENTPDVAVQWYDEAGRVVFWNRASENIFGWTASEAHGKTLDQLILDEEQSAIFKEAVAELRRTGRPVPPAEYRIRRRDGSAGYCFSTVFRIPCEDKNFCFVCMDVDITARKNAERSLREMQERELRSRENFTRALLDAEEQERQRLAAELHDGLGQNLSIITNKAFLAMNQPGIPRIVAEQLHTISQAGAETIAEVRRLVLNLGPLQIEQLGLTDSIRELIEKSARSTAMRLEYRVEDIDGAFHGNAATHLYRIVQEALNNLLKHSGADHASFTVEHDVNSIRLSLKDNGKGFDVQRALTGRGFGLKSISERAQMLGGFLGVKSSEGKGTELVIELPILENHEPES